MAEGPTRARARAWAAEIDAARRRAGYVWPEAEATLGRLQNHIGQWAAQAIKEWLAADADPRTPKDISLTETVKCDEAGCIAKLKDGRSVSRVSVREAPRDCSALVIDRRIWRESGATALRWNGNAFVVDYARPKGVERPWIKAPRQTEADTSTPLRPAARDATPRSDDLEIGD